MQASQRVTETSKAPNIALKIKNTVNEGEWGVWMG